LWDGSALIIWKFVALVGAASRPSRKVVVEVAL
jgi:hypothetical protein